MSFFIVIQILQIKKIASTIKTYWGYFYSILSRVGDRLTPTTTTKYATTRKQNRNTTQQKECFQCFLFHFRIFLSDLYLNYSIFPQRMLL